MPDPLSIFDACRTGDLALLEALYLQDNGIIHVMDGKGYTPLILAVYNGQGAAVDFLLSRGAHPDAQDGAGNTALMDVCFKGYKEIAQKLLMAGADVHIRNVNGATALTFAATFGHLEIAEWLLQRGADTEVPDARGKTPRDHARIQENEPMMLLLTRYARN